jgi:uncharacterized protein (TIGR03437 family)
MRCASLLLCGVTLSLAADLVGQAPVIQSGGVGNAASNVTLTSGSPQMLIAIKGQNLATSTEAAGAYPLPYTLGGATVFFNGQPVPISYASPQQLDVQAPGASVSAGQTYSVLVRTASGVSGPYPIPVSTINNVGVFTQDTTGCGQAVAYNVHADGSVSLNTPRNSLDPTRDWGLTFYLTGLGYFPDRMDGVPWTYNPPDNDLYGGFSLYFGAPGLTNVAWAMNSQYSGPAPGTVGIDQANLTGQSTGGIPQGCHVPAFLSGTYATSQLVDVSIQPGGGSCSDPGDGTLGVINWQQTTVSDYGQISTSAAIVASSSNPTAWAFGRRVPTAPIPWVCGLSRVRLQPVRLCPAADRSPARSMQVNWG